MIEDMARNLQPAAALGMLTVWLDSDIEWATRGANSAYVHYRADDLKGFLSSVQKKLSNKHFVANAPDKVIELERKKASDAREKILLLEKNLESL